MFQLKRHLLRASAEGRQTKNALASLHSLLITPQGQASSRISLLTQSLLTLIHHSLTAIIIFIQPPIIIISFRPFEGSAPYCA
jgi:hypothetical protein